MTEELREFREQRHRTNELAATTIEFLQAELQEAQRQRDELLAVICDTVQVLSYDEPRLPGYAKQALRNLRAAIARARSPSPDRLGQGGSGQAGDSHRLARQAGGLELR